MASLVDLQIKKLEIKLRHVEELEGVLENEKEAVSVCVFVCMCVHVCVCWWWLTIYIFHL